MAEKKYAIYLNKGQLEYMAEIGVNILSERNLESAKRMKKECENDEKKHFKIDNDYFTIPPPNKEDLKELVQEHQNLEKLFDQIVETWKEDNFILE